jgi:uncharacterized membrane protein
VTLATRSGTLYGGLKSARIGDTIATQAGRMCFIVFHFAWFAFWIVLNIKAHGAFDPFPFPLLTMIVSLESLFFFRSSSS